MGPFIVVSVLISVGLIGLLVWAAAQKTGPDRLADEYDAYRDKLRKYHETKDTFIASELEDPNALQVKIEGKHGVISAKDDADRVRVMQFTSDVENFHVTMDRTITFAGIRTVEFVQDDKIQVYRRSVTTPIAVTKNKSAIGRGLVGGALMGPAGLVIGAASALTPQTSVVEHQHNELAERTVKGPAMLVITTKDRENPIVRVEFYKAEEAQAWALWLGDRIAA